MTQRVKFTSCSGILRVYGGIWVVWGLNMGYIGVTKELDLVTEIYFCPFIGIVPTFGRSFVIY